MIGRAVEILKRLNPQFRYLGVEVGVWQGKLSAELLREHYGLVLLMVDQWREQKPGDRYYDSEATIGKLTQEKLDEAKANTERVTKFAFPRNVIMRCTSLEAAKVIPDARVDFVFIDADHTYEAVKEDIEAWWPKVQPWGFIGGHDYDHGHSRWGVKRAVDEFFAKYPVELGENETWFVRKEGKWQ